MDKKRNVPEIRFAGFTDDWEQRKLGEIFDQTFNFTNPEKDNFELYSLTVEDGLTPKTDRYKRDFLVIKQDQFKLVEPYGFVYNPMNITLGAIDYNKLSNSVAVSGYYTTMSVKYGFDHNFLNIFLSSNTAIEIYRSQATGTLKEKQRVQFSTFSTLSIFVPSFEEQTAIGNFFKQLDETIALHQREYEKYKNLKISYLEKMFPKENEQFPELRFPEFTDAWEQRKLGEIVEIIGGGTPDTTNENYWNGSIDWYSPTEIGNNVYAIKSEKTITKLGLEKSSAKLLPANKTILFTSRASIGDMAILKNQGSTNQGFQSFVVGENLDIYFLYSMGYKIKEFALKNASGSTFLEISKNQLALCPISLPSKQEQTAIGNFFKQLDETIALHQRELEKYKQIKQSYLEKMFI